MLPPQGQEQERHKHVAKHAPGNGSGKVNVHSEDLGGWVRIYQTKGEKLGPFALLNARIVESGSELDKHEEGCLSIPGVTGVVERPWTVTVEGLSQKGEPVRIEAEGMLARCLQHEIDHLNGVLFIDHLSRLKREQAVKKVRKAAKVDAPAI